MVLRHDGFFIEFRRTPQTLLLLIVLVRIAVYPCHAHAVARLFLQRPAQLLGKVEPELVSTDCLLRRTLLRVREIDPAPLEEFLDLCLIVRVDRIGGELFLIRRKTAVLAQPDTIEVRIDVLVVNAEILIRAECDEACLHLCHVRLFPTDRTYFLHGVRVLCHDFFLP